MDGGAECGKLDQSFADRAEFARISEAVLESADDAGEIADMFESVVKIGDRARRFDEGADGIAPAENFGEFERRCSEKVFEKACAGGGGGRIHDVEQRAVACAAARFEDFEVSKSGGIEEKSVFASVFTDGSEIFGSCAEIFCDVGDQGAGCAESGVGEIESEAVEIENSESVDDAFGAVSLFELKGVEF